MTAAFFTSLAILWFVGFFASLNQLGKTYELEPIRIKRD